MLLPETVREIIHREHKPARTEEAHVHRTRQLIAIHPRRHPRKTGAPGPVAFLPYTHAPDHNPLRVMNPLDR